MILLPVAISRWQTGRSKDQVAVGARGPGRSSLRIFQFFYFGLLGFAYLLVEMPLIQRFILFLDHPAYALSTVLFSLLLFSGLGSQLSPRLSLRWTLGALVVLLAAMPFALPMIFDLALGLPFVFKMGLTVLLLAPVSFLMGIPFPAGLQRLLDRDESPAQIPWIWAINGSMSVVSSVLATLLALSLGFSWVFWTGALCYMGAWIVFILPARLSVASPPHQ